MIIDRLANLEFYEGLNEHLYNLHSRVNYNEECEKH